jgi:hypothetical protein
LAAAYAEAGDFEKAREWSQKAVEINTREEQTEHLAKELESYRANKPWRERQTVEEDSSSNGGDALENFEKPTEQSIDF